MSAFDADSDDPFLAPAPAAAPILRERPAAAAALPAGPQPTVQPQPVRPQPVQPQPPARPRPSGRLGATADADFLAAARERTRNGSHPYGQAGDPASRPSRLGRTLLYALPVIALIMLSGAGVILVWEAIQGDAQRQAASETDERDFIAQVEAGLSADGRAEPAQNSAATASAETAAETPAEIPAEIPAADPQPAAAMPPATPPGNAVADASGTSLPASLEPVAAQPRNPTDGARVTLESAAAEGHPVARYQLGLRALDSGDAQTAAILLRRAAEQGVPAAQYRYAKLLEAGEGVPQNLEEARRWTERAANAGHRRAMHNLGVMYFYGTGTAQNAETAARWFQDAALLGLRDAQFNLALLYETGDGVPLSLADAYAWFTIAASGADPTAGERAAVLEEMLDPQALEAARQVAANFTPRPIDGEANGIYTELAWDRTVTTDIAAVRRAQGFLSVLGYAPGPVDGEMGQRTRDAIMAFEADQGLPRTGRVDAVLIERLERAAAG